MALDALVIQADLEKAGFKANVTVLPTTTSTNLWLKHHHRPNATSLCLTDSQTQGRGRRGKSWHTEAGRSLCYSQACQLAINGKELSGLSLVVALALRNALAPLVHEEIRLKWPNDLYIKGHKLSGILIESTFIKPEQLGLIIGIGVNLEPMLELEYQTASLLDAGLITDIDPNEIAVAINLNLRGYLDKFCDEGFLPFRQEWLEYDMWMEQRVELIQGTKRIHGIHAGVNASGELMLLVGDDMKCYAAGEMSLRQYDEAIS